MFERGELKLVLDTSSKEDMELSLSTFLDITKGELYQSIDYAAEKARSDGFMFNQDVFDSEINTIINDLQPIETIDNVMCFHLARRLNSAVRDLQCYNLKSLLLTENSLSCFLKEHSIEFEDADNHLILRYSGNYIKLENTHNIDVCYLRSRFGYNCLRKDYCFNGFAMRDLLMKNSYTRELFDGPEFLVVLARYLRNNKLLEDFKKNSTYYCYKLIIPITEIIFDGYDAFDVRAKQLYLINRICHRLFMYANYDCSVIYDNDNPIIRTLDNAILPANYIVSHEEITIDKIE